MPHRSPFPVPVPQNESPPPPPPPSSSSARPPSANGFVAQTLLPLLSSLAVHAAVVVIGVATARAIVTRVQAVRQEQVGAVTSDMPSDSIGDEMARLVSSAERMPPGLLTGSVDPDAPAAPVDFPRAATLSSRLGSAAGGGAGEEPVVTIGLGQGGLGIGGGTGPGKGNRHGPGDGAGDGGGLARFGAPRGAGYNAGSPVFVASQGARRIVFVCDATGTMINRFALLRMELARTIQRLQPVHAYNVIFFRDQGAAAASKDGLLPGHSDNKRKTYQFLDDFAPSGQTNPLPALKLAFAQRPELVYFLTDGEFNNLVTYDEVVAEVTRLNPGRRVRVNTISFGSHDADAERVLQRIAAENGGVYRRVNEEALGE